MLGTGAVVSAKHRRTGGAGIFARASAPFNIKRPIFWRPLAQGALEEARSKGVRWHLKKKSSPDCTRPSWPSRYLRGDDVK